MYYGSGRMNGNIGTYVVEEEQDAWNAERKVRSATAMEEGVKIPKLNKASTAVEEAVYDALAATTSKRGICKLDQDVYFFEFVDPQKFE